MAHVEEWCRRIPDQISRKTCQAGSAAQQQQQPHPQPVIAPSTSSNLLPEPLTSEGLLIGAEHRGNAIGTETVRAWRTVRSNHPLKLDKESTQTQARIATLAGNIQGLGITGSMSPRSVPYAMWQKVLRALGIRDAVLGQTDHQTQWVAKALVKKNET